MTRKVVFLSWVFACLAGLGTPAAMGQREGEGNKSSRRAIAMYADAAAYQNNAAYELAVEEWQRLLKEFPDDPLASKAWHYLGVSYIQLGQPQYAEAIGAFSQALKDKKLEVREESLINLSWCLFNQAREAEPGSARQRQDLLQAKSRLDEFLRQYGDGGHLDQALFYLGEIEYSLGNAKKSIGHYRRLLETRSLARSSLRPDARYAIAVAYEEVQEDRQATRHYQAFLEEHADHRLAREVRVRLADLMLAENKATEAERLLVPLTGGGEQMADYALLRLGYALSRQGKSTEATQKYLELLKKFPDSKHAKTAALSVGQAFFESGKYDQAVEQFASVLKDKDAQAAEAAHWMAITLLRQQKPQRAIQLLEDALQWGKSADNVISLQMDYADALYALPDQLEKARAAYEVIAREHPDDPLAPRAAYNAAFAALQGRRYTTARQWAEFFLARYARDPLRNDVAYVAAEALLQEGEHEAAAQAYAKLRAADPQNSAYSLWTLRMGMANYLAGDYPAAIGLLRKELSRFQDEDQKAEAQFILGASFLYEEEIRPAIEQLTASHLTSDRWNSADEVLLLLSEAHQRNKDHAAAKTTLESLLRKYPNTPLKGQVDYKLAQLSAAMNEFDQAISRYQAIVDNPAATNYHNFAKYGIVWCLMQQEKYADALRRLQPLLRQGGEDSISSEARLTEGVALRKLGRVEEAVVALERFLRTSPVGNSLAGGLYELGLAYTELGKVAEANQHFQQILEDIPEYPAIDKVLYELAWNYEDAEQPQQAARYFGRLVEKFPDSEFSAESTYMLAQQQYEAEQYDAAMAGYSRVLKQTRDPQLLEKSQYKLGWSLFQQQRYDQAAQQFVSQTKQFPNGPLAVDALFMQAECSFKQDRFEEALGGYEQARATLENGGRKSAASEQVKTLIYLHGAQCLREQKRWRECQTWLETIIKRFPETPYLATTLYELGYCKQSQNKTEEALAHYAEVADNYRNEVAARARFMMGEVYFSQRDFVKAIPQFQRVMYGFGGKKAPDAIKNWQVKSAFEAARCSEILIEKLRGANRESREKIIRSAQDFYQFIVENHAAHELAAQAQTRLGELQRLR